MKLTGYEDLRVQRTINNIYQSFEELICEKDYNKITVTELAKRAQINKKTFYRYYETLDDLLAELQARYVQQYLEKVKNLSYPEDLNKGVRIFFEFSATQDAAFDKITTNMNYQGIRQQMVNQVMKNTWGKSAVFNRLNAWEKQLLFSFVEQTGLSIYHQWVANGRQEPLEEVIKQAQELTEGGVKTFLNNK